MSKRVPKLDKVLEEIRKAIASGNFFDSFHSSERRKQRKISRPEILYVLVNGWHEKRKDEYSDLYQTWNYAIRGKTIDRRELRVIVSFDANGMLIITAIDLDLEDGN